MMAAHSSSFPRTFPSILSVSTTQSPRVPGHESVTEGVTATVAQVTVDTLIRGPIEVDEDRIITFASPLFGFEEHLQYLIYQTKPGPLAWLQSCHSKEVAFAVLSPFAVGLDPDYELTPADLEELGATTVEDITVYTVVTLADDPTQTTTNLRAPILVAGSRAIQVIYDSEALDLRFPLASLTKGQS